MSTYLLLRNNQESGPFTFDEVKQMSLKSYDLLWVVGKSAAWLYPGEIAELRSFAPPLPVPSDEKMPVKSLKSDIAARNTLMENGGVKSNHQNKMASRSSTKSVYVNLPVNEKKIATAPPSVDIFDAGTNFREPVQLYGKPDGRPSKAVRFSSRLIWIGTVCLLFGAGILTGFFISDRRKFFSDGAKITQSDEPSNKAVPAIQTTERTPAITASNTMPSTDSLILIRNASNPAFASSGKKKTKPAKAKQDSVSRQPVASSVALVDSPLKLRNTNNDEILYKKIKEHPENYLNVITGKYSTGIFGGISAIPVSLTNNSPVKFDLVTISIQYIQNNGKIYKTEELSFSDIEPGETVTEKAPKSSRGTKISQHISMINSHQIDLHYVH